MGGRRERELLIGTRLVGLARCAALTCLCIDLPVRLSVAHRTAKRVAMTARNAAKLFAGSQGADDELEGFSEASRESHLLAEAYDLWVRVLLLNKEARRVEDARRQAD